MASASARFARERVPQRHARRALDGYLPRHQSTTIRCHPSGVVSTWRRIS